jgi:hypothetical protein
MATVMLTTLVQVFMLGASASLRIPRVDTSSEINTVIVPVFLEVTPERMVAGLQFDLEFDADALDVDPQKGIRPGEVILNAGKQLTCSMLSPGKIRVLIFGINRELIESGELVFIQFDLDRAKASHEEPLKLGNAVLSDLSGNQIPEEVIHGALIMSIDTQKAAPVQKSASDFKYMLLGGTILLFALGVGYMMWRFSNFAKPSKKRKSR